MRFDVQNQLSSAQAFTGAATVSTNSYQKQSAAQDLSIGRRMSLLFLPTVAAGSGSTHTLEAVQADDAALTTNLEVLGTVTALAAALIPGAAIEIQFPNRSMTRTYLGFRNTATGGTTTVTADVYLVPSDEIPGFRTFPKVTDAAV